MRVPRIFVDESLAVGQQLPLPDQAARHVNQVLRLSIGNLLKIFNGKGGEYTATIVDVQKRQVIVRLDSFAKLDKESPLHVHLGQAISRGERMDIALQKSVELGVTAITPLFTERCNVKLPPDRLEKRIEHWQGVIEAACEQCGREIVPALHAPMDLEPWLLQARGVGLVLNPLAAQSISTAELDTTQPIHLLIGPEGGLSDTEIEGAVAKGFIGVRLGPRILRTETAALAVISILQVRYGDF
ncbi:MAG: 16S rRNA (uracil(1498)-N(3))-methyltransferase [Gammaproteobacteria bacterium]|nr:16S rRNA (uracil(1498)-N(3))-methyltransferase [Gammaproteobacteria bacterium]